MSKPLLASEAVIISIDAELEPSGYAAMEKVFSKIHERAKLGYRSIPVETLHITVVEKIKYLGYDITVTKWHFDEEVTVSIKW